MNIRPIDLQVLIPRSMDAAKIASTHEQQIASQQQQLSVRTKQTAEERQRQVQTPLAAQKEEFVVLDTLKKDKKGDKRHLANPGGDSDGTEPADSLTTQDPVLGNKIDIKT